jgi:hypothetical protein
MHLGAARMLEDGSCFQSLLICGFAHYRRVILRIWAISPIPSFSKFAAQSQTGATQQRHSISPCLGEFPVYPKASVPDMTSFFVARSC